MSNSGMLKKQCFVIGPMSNAMLLERQQRLAHEIIAPLLQDQGYEVITPDRSQAGFVIDQVVEWLDRAELVVADVTGNNPNVLYELGVRHCIGRAYVLVKQRDNEPLAFDIGSLRYIGTNLDDVAVAQRDLKAILLDAARAIEQRELRDNPVTKYYGIPLIEVSSGARLARGYYYNFLRPLVQAIIDVDKPFTVDGHQLDQEQRKAIEVRVYLPEDLRQASHGYIASIKATHQLKNAEVQGLSRRFTLSVKGLEGNRYRLADIPTTMNQLNETIECRVGHAGRTSDRWKLLEQEEIDQFRSVLMRYMNEEEDYPTLEAHRRIVGEPLSLADL